MADDFLDAFAGESVAQDVESAPQVTAAETQPPAPAPEPPKETPPAPKPADAPKDQGPPRQADGKFAPVAQAAEAEPASQIPAADDPDKQPISKAEFKGMLDEREKRQKAEAEAKALRDRIARFEQQQPQGPSDQDPDIARRIDSARADAIFTTSERWAKKEHGDEVVLSAMDWAMQRSMQNPAFAAEYLKQDHPIDWAVKQQKRDRILNEIGDDPDAFIEARIAARLANINPAAAAPPNQAAQPAQAASPQLTAPPAQTPAPPRSLAHTASAGGLQAVPEGHFAPFDAAFKSTG